MKPSQFFDLLNMKVALSAWYLSNEWLPRRRVTSLSTVTQNSGNGANPNSYGSDDEPSSLPRSILFSVNDPRSALEAFSLHLWFGAHIVAFGLCPTCYSLKRQDQEYFGGLREQVLERCVALRGIRSAPRAGCLRGKCLRLRPASARDSIPSGCDRCREPIEDLELQIAKPATNDMFSTTT